MLTLNLTSSVVILWNWLVLIALTLWIGILVIEQFILARGRCSGLYPRAHRRTRGLQWVCIVILLVGEIIPFLFDTQNLQRTTGQNVSITGDTFTLFLYSYAGQLALIRIGLLVIGAVVLYWTQKQQGKRQTRISEERAKKQETGALIRASEYTPKKTRQLIETPLETPATPRRHTVTWLLLVSALVFTTILSRSAAEVLQPRISAILFDWLHLIAQGVWLGGFAYLGYILLPLLLGNELEYNTETLIYLLRRLAPLLLAGMGVQLISSLFLGEASLKSYQQLIIDPYGETLLAHSILTLIEVLLSVYALAVLRPKIIHQALRIPVVKFDLRTRRERQSDLHSTGRNMRIIIGLLTLFGMALLLCTALLAFMPPPLG